MKNKFFATVLLFWFGAMFNGSQIFAQSGQQNLDRLQDEVSVLVNKHRRDIGLKPLTINPLIVKEALGHSRNMAGQRVEFGHDGFDERSDRLMKKIKHCSASAENVAYGARTAAAAVDMWLKSPGHRKNIEGDYTLTGIGIAKSPDGKLYYTQIFLKN